MRALRKAPQSEKGKVDHEGRRVIIRRVVEDHTFMIFQLALARRRVQDILEEHDLATVIYWRELTFVHSVLNDSHNLLGEMKKWLLAVQSEVEVRAEVPDGS